MNGRVPSGQALVASPSNPQAVSTEGFDPSRDEEFENDTQRGYAAWVAGEPFDELRSVDWADGWQTADDFAWWKLFGEALGGQVTGFSYRYAGSLIIDGEYHQISGALLRRVAAIAMEAAKPSRREAGSTEGDSAGRRHRPPTGQVTVEEDRA